MGRDVNQEMERLYFYPCYTFTIPTDSQVALMRDFRRELQESKSEPPTVTLTFAQLDALYLCYDYLHRLLSMEHRQRVDAVIELRAHKSKSTKGESAIVRHFVENLLRAGGGKH